MRISAINDIIKAIDKRNVGGLRKFEILSHDLGNIAHYNVARKLSKLELESLERATSNLMEGDYARAFKDVKEMFLFLNPRSAVTNAHYTSIRMLCCICENIKAGKSK